MRVLVLIVVVASVATVSASVANGAFTIADDKFYKDGSVFRILSGSIHYARVPPAYWRDRLLRMRSLGLNAIETYVPWNFHNTDKGVYNFTGTHDLVAFLQTAQEVGLLVLLRPGPYICGEWEFGGFPAWLIGLQPEITIRTYEPGYIAQVDEWWGVLLPIVAPLLYPAGPVVMVQLENEFGSYGDVSSNPLDKQYMEHLLALARQYLGPDVILYTTDGGDTSYMSRGTLKGQVYTVGDFGPGSDPEVSFKAQRAFNKPGLSPPMCTEFYTGWLTHWGESMANTSSVETATYLQKLLDIGGSVSLYMGHGGTNFGFHSGANGGGSSYQPTITSYDYDAPISEAGDHGYGPDGDKFVAIQNVFSAFTRTPPPPEPAPIPKAEYGSVALTLGAGMLDNLDVLASPAFQVSTPHNMEYFGQNYGFILYSTTVSGARVKNGANAVAVVPWPADRAQFFADGALAGVSFRPSAGPVSVSGSQGTALRLDVLVENMGRINYGHEMWDPKGATNITWNGETLIGNWSVRCINLTFDAIALLPFSQRTPSMPAFFRGTLNVPAGGIHDTFVSSTGWHKGMVWINGISLGRYWEDTGPQHTFYVPASFLRAGANDVMVMEVDEPATTRTISTAAIPNFHKG